jgi:hypothetical protein
VKHIFHIFTGVLPGYYLLNSANTQNLKGSLPNCNVKKKEKNVYNKQKIKVFFFYKYRINFHKWYENYHISLMATVTHEIFIFILLYENKAYTYKTNLEYPL